MNRPPRFIYLEKLTASYSMPGSSGSENSRSIGIDGIRETDGIDQPDRYSGDGEFSIFSGTLSSEVSTTVYDLSFGLRMFRRVCVMLILELLRFFGV